MTTQHATPTWITPSVPTAGAMPDDLRMDAVELLVHDLDGMIGYYHDAVGLDVLNHAGASATLGRGSEHILTLRQERDLPAGNPRGAGLYHTAILFENQAQLAGSLLSMFRKVPQTYTGSADHLVSEAFYFTDPEGNGLELYRDRPRSDWQIGPDGSVAMASLPLHPIDFVETWYDEALSPEGTTATVGHVHLQVGDIPTAREFYVNKLGFDVILDGGTALFVSAGGYHHHLGMNTWQSRGAGPRAASLGLGDVRVTLPSREDVAELAARLQHHEIQADDDGHALRFKDPWGTVLAASPQD